MGIDYIISHMHCMHTGPKLSTGRMNPRVTILPDFGGSGRVGTGRGLGQHFGFSIFFTKYLLVHVSIWIFEYYIRIDWFSTIFN